YRPENRFAHGTGTAQIVKLATEGDAAKATGIYAAFNKVNPAVAARAAVGQWHKMQKDGSLTDRDMDARRALYLDCDVVRPKGITALFPELVAAVHSGQRLLERLERTIDPAAIAVG